MDVPVLVTARPLQDALAWRETRRSTGADRGRLRVALVTDGGSRVPGRALAEAGLRLAGLLGPDALESLAWAAQEQIGRAYADLPALLADEVDAVAVDVPPPRSDVLLATAAAAGLGVLLTVPRTGDPQRLLGVLSDVELADLPQAVTVTGRADQAYAQVAALLPRLGAVRQVTAVPWPAGGPPRAELVDLVRRWCGEVVAVCADPAAMPAAILADAPVTLALLTETGATVLAAERFGARQAGCQLTVVGSRGRLALTGSLLRLALAGDPVRDIEVARADAAAGVRLAGRRLAAAPDGAGAAGIGDLVVAGRVLAAVERSRSQGGWVELG